MLKNKLYKIDKWISKGYRVGVVLLLVGTSAVMIQFTSTMFFGISLMGLICLWVVFVKTRISTGQLKFDKSLYTLPIIGETIVAQKDFNYDFAKVENTKNYIHNKAVQNIHKGYEFDIINIEELDDDWIVELSLMAVIFRSNPLIVKVFWLDVKNYFMTITDIREEKLKKILG
jgi:hypothetical protein